MTRDEIISGLEREIKSIRREPRGKMLGICMTADEAEDIVALLKEQEARELTIDEWREWENNPKRNPICKLWQHDTSPMWIINPNEVNEPALLMGVLKLFTGKPTFEQCKEVKWDG